MNQLNWQPERRTPVLIATLLGALLAVLLEWKLPSLATNDSSGPTASSVDTAAFFAAGSAAGSFVGGCVAALLRRSPDFNECMTVGVAGGIGVVLIGVIPAVLVAEDFQVLPIIGAFVGLALILTFAVVVGALAGSSLATFLPNDQPRQENLG